MSGYPEEIVRQKGLLGEGQRFIAKPLLPGVLLRELRDALRSN